MKKSLLFIFSLLFIATLTSKATHIAGGEISYTHVSGLTYKIKLKLYRDCKIGNSNMSSTETIYINSASTSLTSNVIVSQVNSYTLDSYCPNTITNCVSTSSILPGFEVYEYEGLKTLPVGASDWVFTFNSCCRSSAISNIVSPSGQSIDIQTTLNNLNNINNSIQFVNSSQLIYAINQSYSVNSGFIDPDGDSVSFKSVNPLGTNALPISFSAGYSVNNPFGNSNPFSINNATGTLNFSSNLVGINDFALQIDEYRNGILIASTIRDLSYVFLNVSGNSLPTLSGINGGTLNYTHINVCPNASLTFTLNSADADLIDSTFIDWDSTIVNASVTTNNAQNKTATFTWTPTLADVRPQPYIVTFKVKDNKCPFAGQQSYGYLIYVNQCNTDSVWAGDANADFTVNNYDVLNIGIGNGTTGNSRTGATTNWQAEFCADWTNSFMSGINYKHADCNGDGTINATDLNAISLNYGQVHLKEFNTTYAKTLGLPDLYFETNGLQANQGSTLSIPVMFGSSSSLVSDFYGLAGTLEIINSQTTTPITLTNSICWVGNASNSLLFTKNINPTKLDFTLVKTNQTNASGYGQIGTLTLPITTNDIVGSNIVLKFSNVKLIKNDESEISSFNILNDTIIVNAPLSIKNNSEANQILVYPNPITNILNIDFLNVSSIPNKIEIISVFGEHISSITTNEKKLNYSINTNTLSSGIYFIKIINSSTNTAIYKRFVK